MFLCEIIGKAGHAGAAEHDRLRPVRGTRQATVLPDAAALVARLRDARLLGDDS